MHPIIIIIQLRYPEVRPNHQFHFGLDERFEIIINSMALGFRIISDQLLHDPTITTAMK